VFTKHRRNKENLEWNFFLMFLYAMYLLFLCSGALVVCETLPPGGIMISPLDKVPDFTLPVH
jgi:hypothetical protein